MDNAVKVHDEKTHSPGRCALTILAQNGFFVTEVASHHQFSTCIVGAQNHAFALTSFTDVDVGMESSIGRIWGACSKQS
jgi:hypothetical protein